MTHDLEQLSKSNTEIKVMITDDEIMSTFYVMKQLRPHLAEDNYVGFVRRLQEANGYRLVVLVYGGQVKSVAGYKINESLAWGKFMYVDDLITDDQIRKQGFAQLLFDWLITEAKKNKCNQFHLDSGVQRYEAHQFYLAAKMKISCHHFEKSL